jgi:protoheme ferro-lyase
MGMKGAGVLLMNIGTPDEPKETTQSRTPQINGVDIVTNHDSSPKNHLL